MGQATRHASQQNEHRRRHTRAKGKPKRDDQTDGSQCCPCKAARNHIQPSSSDRMGTGVFGPGGNLADDLEMACCAAIASLETGVV